VLDCVEQVDVNLELVSAARTLAERMAGGALKVVRKACSSLMHVHVCVCVCVCVHVCKSVVVAPATAAACFCLCCRVAAVAAAVRSFAVFSRFAVYCHPEGPLWSQFEARSTYISLPRLAA
jgi:hypothetical protein